MLLSDGFSPANNRLTFFIFLYNSQFSRFGCNILSFTFRRLFVISNIFTNEIAEEVHDIRRIDETFTHK